MVFLGFFLVRTTAFFIEVPSTIPIFIVHETQSLCQLGSFAVPLKAAHELGVAFDPTWNLCLCTLEVLFVLLEAFQPHSEHLERLDFGGLFVVGLVLVFVWC